MPILFGASGDIRESLGNPAENEYSASNIALAQLRSTNLINAYLEPVYPDSIPFTVSGDVPALVNTIATDLSIYYLKRDKHRGPSPISDLVKSEYYDKSVELLEKIVEGKMKLPELTAGEGDAILSKQSEYNQTFNEDGETDWTIDDDKLEDISDSRD